MNVYYTYKDEPVVMAGRQKAKAEAGDFAGLNGPWIAIVKDENNYVVREFDGELGFVNGARSESRLKIMVPFMRRLIILFGEQLSSDKQVALYTWATQ